MSRTAWLAEADLLLAFARVLTRPGPDELDTLQRLAATGDDLLAHAGETDPAMATALAELAAASRATTPAALAVEHARLFQGATPCPLDETAYVRRDKGHVLADIAAFHRAFGLERRPGSVEKIDHLPTELEFLALMLVLQAQAVAEHEHDAGHTTADAVSAFAADHLGEFLLAASARLEAATSEPFFTALATALARFWLGFCARRGLATGVAATTVTPSAPDDEAGFACSGCGQDPEA